MKNIQALVKEFVRFTTLADNAKESDTESIGILSEIGTYQIAIDEIINFRDEEQLSEAEQKSVNYYRRQIMSLDAKLTGLRNAAGALNQELAEAHKRLAEVAYQGKNGDEHVFMLPAMRVVGKRVLIPDFTDMEEGDFRNVKLKTYTRLLNNGHGAALVFPFDGLWPF